MGKRAGRSLPAPGNFSVAAAVVPPADRLPKRCLCVAPTHSRSAPRNEEHGTVPLARARMA